MEYTRSCYVCSKDIYKNSGCIAGLASQQLGEIRHAGTCKKSDANKTNQICGLDFTRAIRPPPTTIAGKDLSLLVQFFSHLFF